MQKLFTIRLLPAEAALDATIRAAAATHLAVPSSSVTGYKILKRSIDARSRKVTILLSLLVFINEPFSAITPSTISLPDVAHSKHHVVIVGSGPAGLFAALKLMSHGIRPTILERGKDVRARRRDLARLNKEGSVNPNSNYCFGEGGAGTYSDGKLFTRSTKRGDVAEILNLFVQFGAPDNILYDAHPHIGTNKLPNIITAMREKIIENGGNVLFEKQMTGLTFQNNAIHEVITSDGDSIRTNHLILATGHSARDIFFLLQQEHLLLEYKPFALGVRVEHPQELIDNIQYHCPKRDAFLPPAAYSLVTQVGNRGVFSFCMCPGGIIAPAATHDGEIVVNGWSPSKRNNPYANSGIVAAVELNDTIRFLNSIQVKLHGSDEAMAGLMLQQHVEHQADQLGGGKQVAPAQRMADFANGIVSSSLPDCSYVPGIRSGPLQELLPPFIYLSLANAFTTFGKKMRGYFTNDAVVVAPESRTSSPIRIPRDTTTLQHPQIKGLFPCGEGAGYAGGIVSAALDGQRVAGRIVEQIA